MTKLLNQPAALLKERGITINPKERVLAAIGGKQPDRVPVGDLQIDEPVMSQVAKMLDYESQRVDDGSTREGGVISCYISSGKGVQKLRIEKSVNNAGWRPVADTILLGHPGIKVR